MYCAGFGVVMQYDVACYSPAVPPAKKGRVAPVFGPSTSQNGVFSILVNQLGETKSTEPPPQC